jgi:hypothetical protein
MTRFHPGIRYLASLVKQAKEPWEPGASDKRRRQLPDLFHSIAGAAVTAAVSKYGRYSTRPRNQTRPRRVFGTPFSPACSRLEFAVLGQSGGICRGLLHRLQLSETPSCRGLSNLHQFETSLTEGGRCDLRTLAIWLSTPRRGPPVHAGVPKSVELRDVSHSTSFDTLRRGTVIDTPGLYWARPSLSIEPRCVRPEGARAWQNPRRPSFGPVLFAPFVYRQGRIRLCFCSKYRFEPDEQSGSRLCSGEIATTL